MSSAPSAYLLGHTSHERRRLALQGAILNPLTEAFLIRAGITPGMSALDLGCGVGDVSLVAARLVGPEGRVIGIDLDAGALEIARERAASAGVANIVFEPASIMEYRAHEPFDAAIGRLILIHTPDPLAAIRHAAAQVRPGGIVAFQEYAVFDSFRSEPPKPLFDRVVQLVFDLARRAAQSGAGVRLFHMFQQAGLSDLQGRGEFSLMGSAEGVWFELAAESVRSMLPKFEALGLATAQELDVDTLAERLRQEALTVGGCAANPTLIGVSGRAPER